MRQNNSIIIVSLSGNLSFNYKQFFFFWLFFVLEGINLNVSYGVICQINVGLRVVISPYSAVSLLFICSCFLRLTFVVLFSNLNLEKTIQKLVHTVELVSFCLKYHDYNFLSAQQKTCFYCILLVNICNCIICTRNTKKDKFVAQ